MDASLIREAFGGRSLELILMPTEQCNLRCRYCYESFRFSRMPDEVVAGVVAFICRRASSLQKLQISWFGGEPLLAPEVIARVMEAARDQRKARPELELRSSMTTNAVFLSTSMADRLLALGVPSFQVTFDGPADTHDRRRVHRGGRGTFDRIWNNVSALSRRSENFEVLLRVHLDAETRPRIPELLERFTAVFRGDSRFRVFFKAIGAWGGPHDDSLSHLSAQESDVAITELEDRARELGLAVHTLGADGSVCYAALPNSLVIRANGRIGKCTQALESARNDLGFLAPDGSLHLRPRALDTWTRGWWDGDANALRCPLHAEVAA